MTIYDAALRYKEEGVPLIVIAGKEYGTGSSRDWAAKGTSLLGVRAVIAESYERTHRSNLVGMGVLPLEFAPGFSRVSLGLTGTETYHIEGLERRPRTPQAPRRPRRRRRRHRDQLPRPRPHRHPARTRAVPPRWDTALHPAEASQIERRRCAYSGVSRSSTTTGISRSVFF